MKQVSSAEIRRAITKGNRKLEEKVLGKIVLRRDINGKSKNIKEVKMYNLSDRGQKHVVHVGTHRGCDLRPQLANGEMHPGAHERQGYIYAENGKVYFAACERTLLDSGSKKDDGDIDIDSIVYFGNREDSDGKPQLIEWSSPEHCFSYLGFCFDPVSTEAEFKLFYIPSEFDF